MGLLFGGLPVAIQPITPYAPPLVKYDPSQAKPVMLSKATDLSDRLPYGKPGELSAVFEFKGRGRITGTVKNTPDIPVFRKVALYREPDGLLVKSVWSDPVTGEYEFLGVNPNYAHTVLSYDHTQTYRAVVADRVIPDAIP